MPEKAGTVCVSVIQEEKIFEWKIDDFLQFESSQCSPDFWFSDATWRIVMYPSGLAWNQSVGYGYIGLEVYPESLPKPLTLKMTLGFKTVDGKSDSEETSTCFIDKSDRSAFYRPKVISRSDLIQRKCELLTSGTLTVICTLKNMEPNVVNAHKFHKATAQTEERTAGSTTIDEFIKTEEGTDVLKLQQHFNEIFQNGNFSDVILKVGNQEFKCHRCVLARSPVFLAMMTHEMKEKNTGVVDIQDDEPDIISDFLKYLYTGSKKNIMLRNVIQLYTAADKYQVDELKKSCLDYMMTNITDGNFCDILSLSLTHDEIDLKEACSRFYIKDSLLIVQTPNWLKFMMKNPVVANELHIKQLKNNTKI